QLRQQGGGTSSKRGAERRPPRRAIGAQRISTDDGFARRGKQEEIRTVIGEPRDDVRIIGRGHANHIRERRRIGRDVLASVPGGSDRGKASARGKVEGPTELS